jgi:hypothetical protein
MPAAYLTDRTGAVAPYSAQPIDNQTYGRRLAIYGVSLPHPNLLLLRHTLPYPFGHTLADSMTVEAIGDLPWVRHDMLGASTIVGVCTITALKG